MQVRAKVQVDAQLGGRVKALFPGQLYDLPDEVAEELVKAGKVTEIKVRSRAKNEGSE